MRHAKRKGSYFHDPDKARERNRLAGIASQRPDVLIRRLARMELTADQRRRLADIGAGLVPADER
jgi:hypothetical protein